jgi:DNA-binding NarL/FixJ family response regulator
MAMGAATKIRVTVIENDPLRLIGLRSLLSSERDLQIDHRTVDTALEDEYNSIILLGGNGNSTVYETVATLKAKRPEIRIIVTGSGNTDEDILQAITAGAKGYVHDAAPAAEFGEAVRVVHAGCVWAPGRVLSMFIDRVTMAAQSAARRPPAFTAREREVLQLILEGRTNREIGKALGIETRTVKAHVARIMNRAGVQNRIALSVYAIKHSILPAQ